MHGANSQRSGAAFYVNRRPLFRGYHWPFAILVGLHAVEVLVATIVGDRVFDQSFGEIFAVGDITALLPGWFLIPMIWIGIVAVQLARRKAERPTQSLIRLVRFRGDWLIRGMLILGGYLLMTKSFTVLKSSIPSLNAYYLDPALVSFDIWLLGTDAWRFTHELLPSWFLLAIDRVYVLWFTYVVIMTGVIAFTRDPRFQVRSAIAFHLCWFVLGIILAIQLASVGPVFYEAYFDNHHFEDLMVILREAHARDKLGAVMAIEFLLQNRGTTKLGVGISAMPSIHVALSFLGFLMALQYRGKIWLKVFTGAFTLAILIGSVHLGWHYLSDGLLSFAAAWAIWWLAGQATARLHRPGRSSSLELDVDRLRSPSPTG